MAFIPLPNSIKVVLDFLWTGVEVHNVLYVDVGHPPTDVDMGNVGAAANLFLTTALMPNLSVGISALGCTLTDMQSATAPTREFPLAVPVAGAVAGNSVPNQVSIVTTFQTLMRGRSFRGRAYVPGIPEVELVDRRTISVAYADALNTVWGDYRTDMLAVGAVPVVASFHTLHGPRISGVGTPIASFRTGTTLDTQRRRVSPTHV